MWRRRMASVWSHYPLLMRAGARNWLPGSMKKRHWNVGKAPDDVMGPKLLQQSVYLDDIGIAFAYGGVEPFPIG